MSNGDPSFSASTSPVRDGCLCLDLRRAARAVGRRFDAAFRPLDLTNGQFSLLMALERAQAPSMARISALLAMDRTTLTANLKPLERRGLVAVSVGAADKRSRRLSLTPAGRALLRAALPAWEQTHRAIERHLARADPTGLRGVLRRVAEPDGAPDGAFSPSLRRGSADDNGPPDRPTP